MKKRIQIFLILTLAWMLFCLVGLRFSAEGQEGAEAPESSPPVAADPTSEATVDEQAALEPEVIEPEDPEPEITVLLESVPFDGRTQTAIFSLCGEDADLFCAVMAIGKHESRFTVTAVGDGGKCIGWMQINIQWHTDRMKRLGVTDLTDPVQCAAVAIDYLKELSATFGDTDTHALYMAYNRGPTGATDAMNAGVFSDKYSWSVMAIKDGFKSEMTGA